MGADLVHNFVTMWVVVDPVGTLPVFMAAATGLTPGAARALAVKAIIVAYLVLAGFAVFGDPLLALLDISIESFRIAGGLVLFLFALTLIFGEPKHKRDLASAGDVDQKAVFPVAIPSLASPGAMLTATLLSSAGVDDAYSPLPTLLLISGVMASALLILFAAGPLHRLIKDAGAAVISRVMGMILAAIAVDAVLKALVHIGALDPF